MPTYGIEFHNVMDPDPALLPLGILGSEIDATVNVIDRLRDAIQRLTAMVPFITLYFPPGWYQIHPDPNNPLIIPENVILKFAPGAILVLLAPPGSISDPGTGESASIIIHGMIDAGLQQIFALDVDVPRPTQTDNPPVSVRNLTPTRPDGLVRIDSLMVPVVRPEWWGAGLVPRQDQEQPLLLRSFAHLNEAALQMSINVGWRFRVAQGLPPIPIEWTGPYVLSGQLIAREPPLRPDLPIPGPLMIRGTQPYGNTNSTEPTLVASGFDRELFRRGVNPEWDSPTSLLHIEGDFDFHLENLVLNADYVAESCMTVQRPSNLRDDVQGVFRNCGFYNGVFRLVQLGAFAPAAATQNLGNLSFDRCAFGFIEAVRSPHDGVIFRATETASLLFEECVLNGAVQFMIRSYGGHFALIACTFHCDLLPLTVVSGIDIMLDRPPSSSAPGGFYAQSVESQSPSFLYTFDAPQMPLGSPRGRDVVLDGVHATPIITGPQIPTVLWRGPGAYGASLVLIGCRFRGGAVPLDERLASQVGLVVIGPNLDAQAKVVDVGVLSHANGPVIVNATRGPGMAPVLVDPNEPLERLPPWYQRIP